MRRRGHLVRAGRGAARRGCGGGVAERRSGCPPPASLPASLPPSLRQTGGELRRAGAGARAAAAAGRSRPGRSGDAPRIPATRWGRRAAGRWWEGGGRGARPGGVRSGAGCGAGCGAVPPSGWERGGGGGCGARCGSRGLIRQRAPRRGRGEAGVT